MKCIGFITLSMLVLLLIVCGISCANDVFIPKASKDIQCDAEYTGDAWPGGRTWSLLNVPQPGVATPNGSWINCDIDFVRYSSKGAFSIPEQF